MQRVGLGYDVHSLVTGRPLFLGGVEIPHTHGLDGHSDADVLIHAIADALLGAIGSGDIGFHFPNTDPQWKGAPSRVFLEEIRRMIDAQGGRIINIDASLIAEAPKIVPHLTAMKSALGSALGLDPKFIGIKATTNEGMGFVGRREGIGAFAVAMVDLP
jgi:2-C-methyl-D-erythritol 2,4-cyclodiphosphate synthase